MSLDEDTRWLEWITKQFESIAGEDKEIDLDEFKTALKVKEVRAEHLYQIFERQELPEKPGKDSEKCTWPLKCR